MGLLGADKEYLIRIFVDDYTKRLYINYDKAHISFEEIVKVAEETALKAGVYLEVFR